MQTSLVIERRQLWGPRTTSSTTSLATSLCTPFTLPANGVLSFDSANVVTLTSEVVFQPQCGDPPGSSDLTNADLADPFYASATPQVYVVAAATVLAWVLVTMLTISPRTFFANGSPGTSSFTGGRGIIGGATGGSSPLVGVGSRPWLQKAGALTVAISLTIATADTFRVSARYYRSGGIDGNALREEVENSMEIRVTRAISDIFVWLALVQTLIRLFPRHREKVMIKWIGFALILLDTTFSCLNSFYVMKVQTRPRQFVDAIPALSYLFELAVGLLYAAWVLYYSLTKRRYAFWHPKMKNISILALLSIVSILTPVVFFVTDVTLPDVAGWGDYFRWVGAAAASVVVWEWVERIEALERDEKKDGILGREIFDGDEMLDISTSAQITYNRRRNDNYILRRHDGSGSADSMHGGSGGTSETEAKRGLSYYRTRMRKHTLSSKGGMTDKPSASSDRSKEIGFGHLPRPGAALHGNGNPIHPPQAITPPNRADTASAASTVYIVHQDGTDAPQPVRRRAARTPDPMDAVRHVVAATPDIPEEGDDAEEAQKSRWLPTGTWHAVPNPFKRKRMAPPAEVRAAMSTIEKARQSSGISSLPTKAAKSPLQPRSRWDVKGRLGSLAAVYPEKLRERAAGRHTDAELPWTVIPAQPRGAAAWSPGVADALKSSGTPTSATPVSHSPQSKEERASRDASQELTDPRHQVGPGVPTSESQHTISQAPHRNMQPVGQAQRSPAAELDPSVRRDGRYGDRDDL